MLMPEDAYVRDCDDVVPELPAGFRGELTELYDPLDGDSLGFMVDVWAWAAPEDRWVASVYGLTAADAAERACEWCLSLAGGGWTP